MNKLLRYVIAMCVGTLLVSGMAFAQVDVLQRANDLLKNYTPPAPLTQAPTQTPAESWQQYYAQKAKAAASGARVVAEDEPLHVNTMPSNSVSVTYANAIANQAIAVWGNVRGGVAPLRYILDYGDGTVDSGDVNDPHYIGTDHVYTTGGPKTMVLTVRDANGVTDQSSSIVRVYAAPSKQIRINMAIEKGLLYNYKQQYADGHLYDGYGSYGATGAAMLAFEENGHGPLNDPNEDIYAEYVRNGLNWLLSGVTLYNIYEQEHGNPDSDSDGVGAYFYNETYANGIAGLAIIGAHKSQNSAKNDTIRVGNYAGQTYYDLMVDILDMLAFNQTDNGNGEGGWQYGVATPNYGASDNSAAQWPGLVLEAAENSWGMSIPQFVKDELLKWLQYSQDESGGFAYSYRGSWNNNTKTGAGIGGYASLGYTTDSLVIIKALDYLDTHWKTSAYDNNGYVDVWNGNMYGLYAMAKGLRIINHRVPVVNVGSHNWYDEMSDHLLDHPSWGQTSDGSWSDQMWTGYWAGSRPLTTAFGILILTQGVIIPPPVAVIVPIGPQPPNTSFNVDGSTSFHQDPSKSLVEWAWDFNTADGIDWNNPDASGQVPVNPGYANEGTYTIALRVKDDSDPPLFSIQTIKVEIVAGHHPPVAIAIPPDRGGSYAARVGEPILLDGRASYSPDYPADSVVGYNWDTNGDGIFGDATTDTVTVVFESEHQGQVGLRVYDTQGDSSSNIAYITIVASRRDLVVREFRISPNPVLIGGTMEFFARFLNDNGSNSNASRVLVRFYDDNPLTIGNRLGGDSFVDLPVGAEDTVGMSLTLPARILPGMRRFYVYLDANNQQAEWDETNNIVGIEVDVRVPPPHIELETACLNFATLPLGDSLHLPFEIGNSGPGVLVIDSILSNSGDFWVEPLASANVAPGEIETVYVWFKPVEQGEKEAWLTVHTNDGNHTIELTGQGELQTEFTGQQIFSGLASVQGITAPVGSVVEARRMDGTLITSTRIVVDPEEIVDNINYALSILEGQAGLMAGDTILFVIRTLDCQNMRETICWPLPLVIFAPSNPPAEGFTRKDINGIPHRSLDIPINAGYTSVSWNLAFRDQSVSAVFGDLLGKGKVKILLDFINDGRGNARYDYYIPALGKYNPFQRTDFRKGYFVRLKNDVTPDTLHLTGIPVCPSFPIEVNTGYNFVSFLPSAPDSTGHALASLDTNLLMALDYQTGQGESWFNSYPNGDFTTMAPGKGYFVKVDEPDVLMYPEDGIISAKAGRSKTVASGSSRFSMSNGSTLPLAIFPYGLQVQINGALVPAGSEVKAVDADGIVCGKAAFTAPGVFSMAVYGDDPTTEADEGAGHGEMVKIFINNQMIAQQVQWTEFGETPVVDGSQTVTGVLYEEMLPQVYALHQNFPNPFNPSTSIRFDLPKASHVLIKIYDMLGREVRSLEQGDRDAGYHQVVWDGRNDNGVNVSSGIYTYRLTATAGGETFVATHKMIMLK